MPAAGNTFKKTERLCSHKLIELLFANGSVIFSYPFRIVWLEIPYEPDNPVKIAIAVPKRNFKKAVQRNRIKRVIREGYRKNKSLIYDTLKVREKSIIIMLQYTAKEIKDYHYTGEAVIKALKKLSAAVQEEDKC